MPKILASLATIAGLVLLSLSEVSAQEVTAFRSGERTTGMTKQCFYRALGSEYARTISVTALCPQSIRVQTTPTEPLLEPVPVGPRAENAGRALGRGLRELGAAMRADGDAAERRRADSIQGEINQIIVAGEASASARRSAERDTAEAYRRVVDQLLLEQFLVSPEFVQAGGRYRRIARTSGRAAADTYWESFIQEFDAWKRRRLSKLLASEIR